MKKTLNIKTLLLRCPSEWLGCACALFLQNILKVAFLFLPLVFNPLNAKASVRARIISLAPDLTEIIYALGLENDLVGVSDYSNFPPEAQAKPSVGSFMAPNLEKILLLTPTHVLTRTGATPSYISQILQAHPISVLSFQAQNENDIYETLQRVGQLFGKEKKASELIVHMKKTFLKIQKETSLKKTPSVLVQIEEIPIMVAGRGTLIDRAIILAGGKNAAQAYSGYPKLQKEVAWKLNPDIVILPKTEGQELKLKSIMNAWEHHKKPTAIISGDLLTRATPRFCEGVQKLAQILQ